MSEAEDRAARHRARMARKKALIDAKIAEADAEKGIVVVHTGNGKGKSTAGFGMIARALGHGFSVGIVQFIKGSFSTGEEAFFRRFPEVRYHVMGEGYTWETQDRDRDTETAEAAWEVARGLLQDATRRVVLLDELNIALKSGYLDVETILEDLEARPANQHVAITGRGAPAELIEYADTVSEATMVKHAFQNGIKAQAGVEL